MQTPYPFLGSWMGLAFQWKVMPFRGLSCSSSFLKNIHNSQCVVRPQHQKPKDPGGPVDDSFYIKHYTDVKPSGPGHHVPGTVLTTLYAFFHSPQISSEAVNMT